MKELITIINPKGISSLKNTKKSSKKRKNSMARRRKRRKSTGRKSPKRVAAGRKAARTRKRRRTRPKVTVRVNRKRRRRTYARKRRRSYRRNPRRRTSARGMMKQYFGKGRMTNALMLLVGLGGAGILKGFITRMVANEWVNRLYGLGSIALGATLQMNSRRKELKAIGTGMVVFGLYDVLVSNIPQLAAYLPTIGSPTILSGNMDYGRNTYYNEMMGAGVHAGPVEVVGGNISMDMTPEIIGDEMNLEDAIEMAV